MSDVEVLESWFAWLLAPRYGASRLRAALERTGGVQAARRAALAHPREFGLEPETRAALAIPDRERVQAHLAWMEREGHRFVPLGSPDYPPQLAASPDAPLALFIDGSADALWLPGIAVVGSRSASPGGCANATAFSSALVRGGLSVVSGLALGVDAHAHGTALDEGGRTVAVCATGLDLVYPERHRDLADRIRAQGALVSEFPLGTPARGDHFPRRNRIIAGLALGTLVIEAGLRSGSLITARLAAERGREVFAVPGSIHNPLARGCHRLIREGATLVETAQDVIDALAPQLQDLRASLAPPLAQAMRAQSPAARIDPRLAPVLAALGHDPVTLDDLAARTGLPAGALSSALTELELAGALVSLGGSRYVRT